MIIFLFQKVGPMWSSRLPGVEKRVFITGVDTKALELQEVQNPGETMSEHMVLKKAHHQGPLKIQQSYFIHATWHPPLKTKIWTYLDTRWINHLFWDESSDK